MNNDYYLFMILGLPLGMLVLAIGGLLQETLFHATRDGNKVLKYLYLSFFMIAFFCTFFMGDAVAMYLGLFRLP